MKGHEYKLLVGRYIVSAFGDRGIEVYDEVTLGTSILGKPRRIDLLVLERGGGAALAVECKYQDSAGTADEKIPYALQDLASMRVPGVIAYAGTGYSDGVLHLLQSSERAAYCLPDTTGKPLPRAHRAGAIHEGTWQLDHVLAQAFGWWDLIVGAKPPLALDRAAPSRPDHGDAT